MKKLLSFLTSAAMALTSVSGAFSSAVYAETPSSGHNEIYSGTGTAQISAGGVIGEALSSELDTSGLNDNISCGVTDVTITGNIASVSYFSDSDGTIIVGLYSDDGTELIATGSQEISAENDAADIIIETNVMPEFFDVKAYIVDTETLRPMSMEFETPMYTKNMHEFLQLTTEDFDEELVVNLDTDSEDNFLVYSDSLIMIPSYTESDKNKVVSADSEKNIYVFSDIDENISGLKVGDTFWYEYEKDNILCDKVSGITFSGSTATVTCGDFQLEDAFAAIKISAESENLSDTPSYRGTIDDIDGLTLPSYDDTTEFSFSKGGENGAFEGSVSLTGSVETTITPEVTVYFAKALEVNYAKLECGVEFELAISGSANGSFSPDIPGKNIPVVEPVLSIEIKPEIEIEIEIAGSVTAVYAGSVGFTAHAKRSEYLNLITGYDINRIGEPIHCESLTASCAITLTITPALDIMLAIPTSKVLALGIQVSIPITAEVTLIEKELFKSNMDSKHGCAPGECMSGAITVDIQVFPVIYVGGENGLELEDTDASIGREFGVVIPIIDEDEGAFFIRNGKFHWGSCPYYVYKNTFYICDSNKDPIPDASVSLSGKFIVPDSDVYEYINEKGTTDKNGEFTIYLPVSLYSIEVEAEGYEDPFSMYSDGFYIRTYTHSQRQQIILHEKIKDVKILTPPDKTEYYKYQGIDLTGGQLEVKYVNGKTEIIPIEFYMIYGFSSSTPCDELPVTVDYHGFTDTFNVTVKEDDRIPQRIEMKDLPKTEYKLGESLSLTGGTINLYYEGITEPDVINLTSSDVKVSGFDSSTEGMCSLDVKYMRRNANGKLIESSKLSTSYTVEIKDTRQIEKITIGAYPKKDAYRLGESLDLTGGKIKVIYDDGSFTYVDMNSCSASGFDSSTLGRKYITISYRGKTAPDFDVMVLEDLHTIRRMYFASTGSCPKVLYNFCGELNINSASFTVEYYDNTTEKVSLTEDMISGFDTSSSGVHCMTITYEGNTLDYYYGVKPEKTGSGVVSNSKVVTGVGISSNKAKTSYLVNEEVDTTNLKFKVDCMNIFYSYSEDVTAGMILKFSTRYPGTEIVQVGCSGLVANYKITVTAAADEDSVSSVYVEEITDCSEDMTDSAEAFTTEPLTAEFTGLNPNAVYNLYIMRARESKTPFADTNLYYIAQGKTDDEGNITFTYIPKTEYASAEIFVELMDRNNIADAQVNVPEFEYSGETIRFRPEVTYNGNILTEGKDYYLCGGYNADSAGTYTLIIKGTGKFWGIKTVDYTVTYNYDITVEAVEKMTAEECIDFVNSFNKWLEENGESPYILTEGQLAACSKVIDYDYGKSAA